MKLDFVTIKRYRTNDLHGFILAESKKLLALQYIVDFMIDGILILDKRYIHEIARNNTSQFQLTMMEHFGLTKDIQSVNFDLKNWRSFFDSIANQHAYCMIEDEFTGIDMTYIGKIEKVKKRHLVMHQFSGAGNWDKDKTHIYYDWISMVHLDGHYVNLYQQYFNATTNI